MTNKEILEKILRDYPAGTKFKSAYSSILCISKLNGIKEIISNTTIPIEKNKNITTGKAYVYHNDKWAEIIQDEPNIYII